MSSDRFYGLISEFQQQYMQQENYEERKRLHRNPIEVKSEMVRKLGDLDLAIQNREIMRDNNIEKKELNYVPSLIKETWRSDKRLKSLYNAIKRYCEVRNKDFITIAVHMAEYRAVNRLILRIRRDIRLGERPSTHAPAIKRFTFNDWLGNKFYIQKDDKGDCVANDSEKYEGLVKAGAMEPGELIMIRTAQQKAYEYLVLNSVMEKKKEFETQMKERTDVEMMIEKEIEVIKKFNIQHPAVWNTIISKKMDGSSKYGAKFLLPEHFKAIDEKRPVYVWKAVGSSNYEIIVEGKAIRYPTVDQLQYAMCEFNMHWLRLLTGYRDKLKFEEMQTCSDFKMLIDKYGDDQVLKDDYMKRLEFASDRELFIIERIRTYESVIPRYQSSIVCQNQEFNREIKVDTGQYRRTGYAWVIKGYNASGYELASMAVNNASIVSDIPNESRYGIYTHELKELAVGGSIAYHIAFLKEELKRSNTGKKKKAVAVQLWLGTDRQREQLIDALAADFFVENSEQVRANFLKNEIINWLADGRSLFYMMGRLQASPYNIISPHDQLGPIVKRNFTDKNGEPFKNINQSLNGMRNDNKTGKPRAARKIDPLLQKVFSR